MKEIDEKYPEGAIIANPSIGDGDGDKLYGKKYLEIPKSNETFSKIEKYKKIALKEYSVEIIFQKE